MSWQLLFSKDSAKDAKKIQRSGMRSKVDGLLDILARNPFQNPPPFEKLSGDLHDYYSRRINIQHRLVYRVDKHAKRVFIESMWTHYE